MPIATIGERCRRAVSFADALPVLPISVAGAVVAGRPDPAACRRGSAVDRAGRASSSSSGAASAVVTNPISKAMLYPRRLRLSRATPSFSPRSPAARASDAVMMLVGAELKVVPVTIHIPLKEVIGALTTER